MKNIKQIAEELGKSKEAVRQKIRKLELQAELVKIGNKLFVNELQERLILQEFLKSKKDSANQAQTSLQENTQIVLRFLERENELLRTENVRLQEQNEKLTAAVIAAAEKKPWRFRLPWSGNRNNAPF
jgi:DNA-binding Lrp family transcriptional regulator